MGDHDNHGNSGSGSGGSGSGSTGSGSTGSSGAGGGNPGGGTPGGGSPDGYIDHSVDGKYILLKVPDYENSGGSALSQAQKNTYVNLGRGMGEGALRPLPAWFTETLAASPAKDSEPAKAARKAWTASGLDSDATTDDASGDNLLVAFGGFADDKRLRDGAGTFDASGTPPNEPARSEKAAPYSALNATASDTGTGRNLRATEQIPDYVGWRDHTDGHRITTTRGDKIEIIGGNYKLVSLGRGTGVATYEMSGGIILDGDEPPGQISSVSWRPCPTDPGNSGWKVVEQVVKGNVVERYHGSKREEFYGDVLISVTGSPGEVSAGIGLGADSSGNSIDGSEAYVAIGEESLRPAGTLAKPTKWDEEGGTPPKLQQPDIHESTWAKSITAYTHANSVVENTEIAGTITEKLHVTGKHAIDTQYEDGYWSNTGMHAAGKYFVENWNMMGSGGFVENFFGAMTQNFFGASTTFGLSNRFEIFLGFEEQMNFGGFFELKVGKAVEIMAGSKTELETESLNFFLAEKDTTLDKLEATVSSMKTKINENTAILKNSNCGLTHNQKWLLNSL